MPEPAQGLQRDDCWPPGIFDCTRLGKRNPTSSPFFTLAPRRPHADAQVPATESGPTSEPVKPARTTGSIRPFLGRASREPARLTSSVNATVIRRSPRQPGYVPLFSALASHGLILMATNRTKTILIVCVLALAVTMVATPSASAERVTGCLDGWGNGDADCALGDYPLWPPYDCVQDCDGPPDS